MILFYWNSTNIHKLLFDYALYEKVYAEKDVKYIHSYASSFNLDFEIIYCKTWNFNKLEIWYTHSFDFLIVLSLQRWDISRKHFHSFCTLLLLGYIETVASNPVDNESSKVMTSYVLDLLWKCRISNKPFIHDLNSDI